MIRKLHIKNFKSIKDLELNCSRVNIFIGEPNTGKSNILESIGIFTAPFAEYWGNTIAKKLIRMEKNYNIFFNENTDNSIEIDIEDDISNVLMTTWTYDQGTVVISGIDQNQQKVLQWFLDLNLAFRIHNFPKNPLPVRFYRFEEKRTFTGREGEFLTPPDGENLPQLIRLNENIQQFVFNLLAKYGYKLDIDKHENTMRIYREKLISESLPYFLTSDTIQRIIFFYVAIETNTNSILLFEEPESHIFPFYNEQLALMISNDSNQFFVATHNPYFLNMLINKTPSEQLKVFKVGYNNYETHATPIDKDTLQNFVINDNDILLNIDRLGVS